MNYLHNKLISGEHFEVWQYAERNIVCVDDVAVIAEELLQNIDDSERIINIAAEKSSSMVDVVRALERIVGTKGNYSLVPKGAAMPVDSKKASAAARLRGIDLGNGYLEHTVAKYYSPSTIENRRRR